MTKFRPCIDIRRGCVTQIIGSTLGEKETGLEEITNFATRRQATEYAELYKGLSGGHIVMLDRDQETRNQGLMAVKKAASLASRMQIGGGLDPESALPYLDAGASHVICTSYIFTKGEVDYQKLKQFSDAVGSHRLVLDLSCRRRPGSNDMTFYVVCDRWQNFTNLAITPETVSRLGEYCDEFLIHGVDVEGKRQGIQEDLIQVLAECKAEQPITYAGGVRNLQDLDKVQVLSKGTIDVSVGSALDIFGGDLSFESVLQWNESQKLKK